MKNMNLKQAPSVLYCVFVMRSRQGKLLQRTSRDCSYCGERRVSTSQGC